MPQEDWCAGLDEFRIAHKPESADKLIKRAANDFNNILAVIGGYAELLRNSIGAEDKSHNYVREILASVERGAELTKILLAFSGKQGPHKQGDDLNRVVANL